MSLEKPGWNGSEKEMATGAGEDVEENCATGGGVTHRVSQALFLQRHCRSAVVPDTFIWLLPEACVPASCNTLIVGTRALKAMPLPPMVMAHGTEAQGR